MGLSIFFPFSIALKRFLYLWKIDILPWYGITWIFVSGIMTVIHFSHFLANLYGARLWEKVSPTVFLMIFMNGRIWIFSVLILPIIIYGAIGMEINSVVVTLNRKNSKLIEKEMKGRHDELLTLLH